MLLYTTLRIKNKNCMNNSTGEEKAFNKNSIPIPDLKKNSQQTRTEGNSSIGQRTSTKPLTQ